jgi:hypothetical protein
MTLVIAAKEEKEWIPVTKLGRLVKDGLKEHAVKIMCCH